MTPYSAPGILKMPIILAENEKPILNIDIIYLILKKHYGYDFLTETRRFQSVITPKRMMCYFCNKYPKIGYQRIADYIGFKEHSNVIHHVRRQRNYIDTDKAYRQDVELIELKFKEYIK